MPSPEPGRIVELQFRGLLQDTAFEVGRARTNSFEKPL